VSSIVAAKEISARVKTGSAICHRISRAKTSSPDWPHAATITTTDASAVPGAIQRLHMSPDFGARNQAMRIAPVAAAAVTSIRVKT